MAVVIVKYGSIVENIHTVNELMKLYGKDWSLVVKVLGGNHKILQRLIKEPIIDDIHSIASSYWQELQDIRKLKENVRTMSIKPTFGATANRVVGNADVSLDSAIESIVKLNVAAKQIKTKHKIIVMIELGDLREGLRREGLIPFYDSIASLPNIDLIGMGANIGCMFGDLPTYDKLLQLVIYAQLIETRYNHTLETISGGTSITLPLLAKGQVPPGINHFRIGEAVFLGTSPYDNKPFMDLHEDGFMLEANILEIFRRESLPKTKWNYLPKSQRDRDNEGEGGSYKALVDFGLIDVNPKYLTPCDESITLYGSSSDLSVYDCGVNSSNYKVGDTISFRMKYMGLAQLMNSKHIDVRIMD